MRRSRAFLLALVSGALVQGCSGSADEARRQLTQIHALDSVLGAEAASLQPAAYADVTRQLGALQASYEHGDYRAVNDAAPQLQARLIALRAELVAAKAAARAAQNAEWARYASVLPDQFALVERRLDQLAAAHSRAARTVDVAAAQREVRAAVALWSKGQSAFAAGNLTEALQVAHEVQERADALTTSLAPRAPP